MIKKNIHELTDKTFSSKEILFLKSDSETEKTVDIVPECYLSDKIYSNPLWMESFIQRIEDADTLNTGFLCAIIKQNFARNVESIAYTKSIHKKNKIVENNEYREPEQETKSENHTIRDKKILLSTEIMLAKLAKEMHGLWERIDDNIFALIIKTDISKEESSSSKELQPQSIILKDHNNYSKAPKIPSAHNIKSGYSGNTIINNIQKDLSAICKVPVSIGIAWFPFMDFTKKDTFYNAVKALDHSAFLGDGSIVFFDSVSLNISGDRLYHLGKTECAAEEYQKGLDIDNNNINLINSLGVCFGVMKNLKKAKDEFEKAITLDNNEIMAIYNTGLIYEIMDEKEKALEYFCKASKINNQIFEVELATGKLFYKTKQFDKAIKHLKKAANLNPFSGAPLRIMGDLFIETEEYEKSVKAYKRAIKINPDDALSLSGLSVAFERQNKNLDIALSLARKSVSMEPNNPLLRSRLDKIYKKKETDNIVHIKFEKSYT